ncbi:hypothetical protein BC940DRAFT_301992 [Gongronella butleri]|nr:hypothetical protein BC940DRAFT_301992 [Gongronella butleri]
MTKSNSSKLHVFQDAFWSPGASTTCGWPDFTPGFRVLHDKLAHSIQENKTIIKYVQQRIQTEQQYALSLQQTAATHAKLDGWHDADDRTLKRCFEVVCQESASSADVHRTRVSNLTAMALDPVQRMANKYKTAVESAKAAVNAKMARFDAQAKKTAIAQQDYHAKCQKVLAQQPGYRPPPTSSSSISSTSSIDLAGHAWSRRDLIWLLTRLQQAHHPLLGRHLFEEMRTSVGDNDADHVCQDLVTQGWIIDRRQPTATFDKDTEYTLADAALLASDNDDESPASSSSSSMVSTASSSASAGTFSFWSRRAKQPTPFPVLCQDMYHADVAYKQAVMQLESQRMEIEEALFAHFDDMESLELERIQTLKQAFISMAAALSNTIPIYQDTYNHLMLYQETLHPEKDIRAMVEHCKTGKFTPRPIVYENYFDGPATDQLFGVSLQDIALREECPMPLLLTNGLASIEERLEDCTDDDLCSLWTAPIPLERIHRIRQELNASTHLPITVAALRTYDVIDLSCVLWLYLLELPECLTTSDLYDTIRLLYAGSLSTDNLDTHLLSLGNLMATLPDVNYTLVKALLAHFKGLLDRIQEEARVPVAQQALIHRFSRVFVRPDAASGHPRHDRHPHRLLGDLLSYGADVFTAEVDTAHATHCQRQKVLFQRTSQSTAATMTHMQRSAASSIDQERIFQPLPPPPPTPSASEQTPTVTASPSIRRRAPMPMPSTSTLFEDPEELPSRPPPPAASGPPAAASSANGHTNAEEADDDDHISLDSFFLG